jgi:hypothetical protein
MQTNSIKMEITLINVKIILICKLITARQRGAKAPRCLAEITY